MANGKCFTKSSAAGFITEDNKQAVENTPSDSHKLDYSMMICLLQEIKTELKIMNLQMQEITDDEVTEEDL